MPQTLFGDDVTGCLGKRALPELTPMRVAGGDLVVIWLKATPSSNGTGPKAPAGEKAKPDEPAADNGVEPHPEAMGSS